MRRRQLLLPKQANELRQRASLERISALHQHLLGRRLPQLEGRLRTLPKAMQFRIAWNSNAMKKKPKSLIGLGFSGSSGTAWNQLKLANGGAGGN